jgi:hypothetical protein
MYGFGERRLFYRKGEGRGVVVEFCQVWASRCALVVEVRDLRVCAELSLSNAGLGI